MEEHNASTLQIVTDLIPDDDPKKAPPQTALPASMITASPLTPSPPKNEKDKWRMSLPPSWFTNNQLNVGRDSMGRHKSPGKAPVTFDWVLPLAPTKSQYHLSGKNKLPTVTLRPEEWRNHVMLQAFHWFYSNDGTLWRELSIRAKDLAKMGITSLWLPPISKGAEGTDDVGYAVYDLWDVGEFDQKGTTRTRWGTKAELEHLIKTFHEEKLQVFADVVFNQRQGGDQRQQVMVQEYDPYDRQKKVGEPFDAYAWTDFSCRSTSHSSYHWDKDSFETVGWIEWKDQDGGFSGREGVFQIVDRPLELHVSKELNGYSFLCACDVWEANKEVEDELVKYGKWLIQELNFDGFRLDAVKHISYEFFARFLYRVRHDLGRNIPAIGEYYSNDIEELDEYVTNMEQSCLIFDFPLRTNILMTSNEPNNRPLKNIFDGTVVKELPYYAVVFQDNHDLQPLREPHAFNVQDWFKPLSYSIMLLRKDGYPCVFYPDLFGAVYKSNHPGENDQEVTLNPVQVLPTLLHLRQSNSWGEEYNFIKFLDLEGKVPNEDNFVIGWTRSGDVAYPNSGLAVVLNSGDQDKTLKMYVGKHFVGREFVLAVGAGKILPVFIDKEGWGFFTCGPKSVSVYIPK